MFGQRRSASADAAEMTPEARARLALRLGRRAKAWAKKHAEAKKK